MYQILNGEEYKADNAEKKEKRKKYQRQIASYIDDIGRILNVRKILKEVDEEERRKPRVYKGKEVV